MEDVDRVRYKITIEEIRLALTQPAHEYQLVSDTGNPKDGGRNFAYIEPPRRMVEKTEKVYEQTVDELTISEIAKAVNGIR